MLLFDEHCYTASIHVEVSADKILDYLREPESVGEWAFGAWKPIKPLGDNVYQGNSLFNDGDAIYRLNVYEKHYQIDYEVGPTVETIQPWLMVRIVPGGVVGYDANTSLVSIIAWRNVLWGDNDWKLVATSHEAEVFRLKYLLERDLG